MKRKRRAPLRVQTAYHEAGHAAMGFALGRRPYRVTIVPAKDYEGVCKFYRWRPKDADTHGVPRGAYRDRMERELMINFGGYVAHERLMGRPPRQYGDGLAGDLASIMSFTGNVAGDAKGESLYLEWILHRARGYLHIHWPFVVMLAKALLEHGTLRKADLERLWSSYIERTIARHRKRLAPGRALVE